MTGQKWVTFGYELEKFHEVAIGCTTKCSSWPRKGSSRSVQHKITSKARSRINCNMQRLFIAISWWLSLHFWAKRCTSATAEVRWV